MKITSTKTSIKHIFEDPCASFWIKQAIRDLLKRDPVDAWIDAVVLCAVMKIRLDEMHNQKMSQGVN